MIPDETVKVALASTIGQMFVMIDMIKGIHRDGEKMGKDIHDMYNRTGMVQCAVEVLTKQKEKNYDGKGGGKGWNVLESKAVADMKMLGAHKIGFRM